MPRDNHSRHANTCNRLKGSICGEKLKQLEAVLTPQQHIFTTACESNENDLRIEDYYEIVENVYP